MTHPQEPGEIPPSSGKVIKSLGIASQQSKEPTNLKEIQPSIPIKRPSPIKEKQEETRSFLAISIARGLAGLVVLTLAIIAVDKVMMYQLIWNAPRSSTGDLILSEESLVMLKKDQDQASSALVTVLVTAGFSALSGALGFYFGNQQE